MKITREELIKALNEMDKDLRPYAILANNIYGEMLKEFETKYVIELLPNIPTDTIYLIDRDNYEITIKRERAIIDGIVGGVKHD